MIVLPDQEMIVRELRDRMAPRLGSESPEASVAERANAEAAKKTILEQVSRAKEEAERTAIVAALESTQWNRKKAAVLLKIDYKALLYKIKKLDIDDKIATLPAGGY